MFEWLKKRPEAVETKASQAMRAVIIYSGQAPRWTNTGYIEYAKEGYEKNVYCYACVRLIAMSCAGIRWIVRERNRSGQKTEMVGHPLAGLLKRPNPQMGRSRFVENLIGYLMIGGNGYIEKAGPERRPPLELYPLRPDRMKIVPGSAARPVASYEYNTGSAKVTFQPEEILHLPLFNPRDDWYGLAPLKAAARSIDQSNESKNWNLSLLQNFAKPPGVLKSEGNISDEQYLRIKQMVDERYAGDANAGRPMILEGGLDWKDMGFSPADMEWLEGQHLSAREIAIAFGVPPEMIGDSANKSYSNYKEAREAFYLETILPLMDWLKDELNSWLVPLYPDAEKIELAYDEDDIEALQDDRMDLWNRATQGVRFGILKPNEARAMIGLPPDPNGDMLYVPPGHQPAELVQQAGWLPQGGAVSGTETPQARAIREESDETPPPTPRGGTGGKGA